MGRLAQATTKRGGAARLWSACQHDEPHNPSSLYAFRGDVRLWWTRQIRSQNRKVGRPIAQHSLSVRYALSLIEPPKANVAALVVTKPTAILPSRLDLSPSGEAGPRPPARSSIVTDKTMLIYVGKRPLREWPSGTGSDSELPISLTTNFGLHWRAKNVQHENIFPATSRRRHQDAGLGE